MAGCARGQYVVSRRYSALQIAGQRGFHTSYQRGGEMPRSIADLTAVFTMASLRQLDICSVIAVSPCCVFASMSSRQVFSNRG